MTLSWPLLILSCSCSQLASPVFLLSNYIEIDTNQRERQLSLGKTNSFKFFVLLFVLYTCCLIELFALALSIPADTTVGNHSAGTSDFWSCSAFFFSDFLDLVICQAIELFLLWRLCLVFSAFLGPPLYFFPSYHCHSYLYAVWLYW